MIFNLFKIAGKNLSPCPHCGGDAHMSWFGCTAFQVRCLRPGCHASMIQYLTGNDAMAARRLVRRWNRRKP